MSDLPELHRLYAAAVNTDCHYDMSRLTYEQRLALIDELHGCIVAALDDRRADAVIEQAFGTEGG